MRITTVLYVHRDFVGRTIPFDKIYFFHKDDEKEIPRVFPSAFVLPINKKLAETVGEVLETSSKRLLQDTNATEYKLRYNARGFNRLDAKQHEEESRKAESRIWEILRNKSKYVALIPVLFTRQKPRFREKAPRITGKKLLYPQYLAALKRRKADDPQELMKGILGAKAYFIHRGEVFKPLCLLCPRSIDSVVGDCTFGSKECFFNLGRVGESDFTRGVKAYRKMITKIDEPELKLKETPDA